MNRRKFIRRSVAGVVGIATLPALAEIEPFVVERHVVEYGLSPAQVWLDECKEIVLAQSEKAVNPPICVLKNGSSFQLTPGPDTMYIGSPND